MATVIEEHVKWLRARVKREGGTLAALTGQDSRALRVMAAALELYVSADGSGRRCAIEAMGMAVAAMQPQCRDFAKKMIPAALDWSDEDRLWFEIEAISEGSAS